MIVAVVPDSPGRDWTGPIIVSAIVLVVLVVGALLVRRRWPDVRRTIRRSAAEDASPTPGPGAPQGPGASSTPHDERAGIFISYRRADSADATGRLYDRLAAQFDRERLFKDVDSIPLGLDFRENIDQAIARSAVLLAVIGPRWLETGGAGARLKDPHDHLRLEIEAALRCGIPIIPVLVNGATMPLGSELPESLVPLVYRNAIEVRADPDFHHDTDRLIRGISLHIGE